MSTRRGKKGPRRDLIWIIINSGWDLRWHRYCGCFKIYSIRLDSVRFHKITPKLSDTLSIYIKTKVCLFVLYARLKFPNGVVLAMGKVRNTVLGSYPSSWNYMKLNKYKYSDKLNMADHTVAMSYFVELTLNLWYIQNNFKSYDFSWTSKEILFQSGTLGKVVVEIRDQNICPKGGF